MKRLFFLVAFLCAFLPASDLRAQGFEFEHRITDGAELCTVIDPRDDIFGVDEEGNALGLGTLWTDVAQGWPDLRTARSLAFEIPGMNPEGFGHHPDPHPGDPESIIIRLTIKERRWIMWENGAPWEIPGRPLFSMHNSYQLAHNPVPSNPSFEYVTANYGIQSAWDWWTPLSMAPFDGSIDGQGASGWRFSCGKLDWPHHSAWCQPGSWDYHTSTTTLVLDWADLSYNARNAWRVGDTHRLKYLARQMVNPGDGYSVPDGPRLSATNEHFWAIAWGNRPTVDIKVIALGGGI